MITEDQALQKLREVSRQALERAEETGEYWRSQVWLQDHVTPLRARYAWIKHEQAEPMDQWLRDVAKLRFTLSR